MRAQVDPMPRAVPPGSSPNVSTPYARPRCVPIGETLGAPEARGATIAGTQVHSLRLRSFVVSTEIVFAAEGERLSIRHDAGETPAPYVAGTLLAIRAAPGRIGLTRGLDQLLDSSHASRSAPRSADIREV